MLNWLEGGGKGGCLLLLLGPVEALGLRLLHHLLRKVNLLLPGRGCQASEEEIVRGCHHLLRKVNLLLAGRGCRVSEEGKVKGCEVS